MWPWRTHVRVNAEIQQALRIADQADRLARLDERQRLRDEVAQKDDEIAALRLQLLDAQALRVIDTQVRAARGGGAQ